MVPHPPIGRLPCKPQARTDRLSKTRLQWQAAPGTRLENLSLQLAGCKGKIGPDASSGPEKLMKGDNVSFFGRVLTHQGDPSITVRPTQGQHDLTRFIQSIECWRSAISIARHIVHEKMNAV